MTSQQTLTWLKIASGVVIGFGLLTAAAAHPSESAVVRIFLDLAFWPLDGAQIVTVSEIRLICAVAGDITTG